MKTRILKIEFGKVDIAPYIEVQMPEPKPLTKMEKFKRWFDGSNTSFAIQTAACLFILIAIWYPIIKSWG